MNMKRAILCGFSLFLILLRATTLHASDNEFCWEIRSTSSTVYILGSIHFAKPEMYPLPEVIEKGFAQADNLVLELNPATIDPSKMQRMVHERGLYPDGKTVEDELDADVTRMLHTYLEKNNIPLATLQKMRPGYLAITLSTLQAIKMGYLPQFGIDMYFALKALQNGKKIIELETMEEQLSLLLNMPDENLFLKYTLRDLENAEKLFKTMIRAWQDGDAAAMNGIILEPYENNTNYSMILEKIFFARNQRMTEKIKKLLGKNRTSFVVVGAGHLVGNKGIVALLKNSGYKVRQL